MIYANTLYPERNRELTKVSHANNFEGADGRSFYYGFDIWLEIDLRETLDVMDDDEKDDPYTGRIFTKNSILFTMPGIPYIARHDRGTIENALINHQPILDSYDDHIHGIESDEEDDRDILQKKRRIRPERTTKHLLLIFPDFVELNTKVLTGVDDNECPTIPLQNVYGHPKFRENETLAKHFIIYQVARVDVQPNKKGRVTKRRKNKLGAAFGFGGDDDASTIPDFAMSGSG